MGLQAEGTSHGQIFSDFQNIRVDCLDLESVSIHNYVEIPRFSPLLLHSLLNLLLLVVGEVCAISICYLLWDGVCIGCGYSVSVSCRRVGVGIKPPVKLSGVSGRGIVRDVLGGCSSGCGRQR